MASVRICVVKKQTGVKNVTHRISITLNASLKDIKDVIDKQFGINTHEKYDIYYIDTDVKCLFGLENTF